MARSGSPAASEAFGTLRLPEVRAFAFGGGAGRAFAAPATTALLPQLLRPVQFANANSWVALTSQLASISGPAAGGVLIALSGAAGGAYLAAAAGQLVFVGLLATLPAVAP